MVMPEFDYNEGMAGPRLDKEDKTLPGHKQQHSPVESGRQLLIPTAGPREISALTAPASEPQRNCFLHFVSSANLP